MYSQFTPQPNTAFVLVTSDQRSASIVLSTLKSVGIRAWKKGLRILMPSFEARFALCVLDEAGGIRIPDDALEMFDDG